MAELSPEEAKALLAQTMELGRLLHQVQKSDPEGLPTEAAVTAFRGWVQAAGSVSTEPRYFEDILENYDAPGRSNKDLFDVFELLDPYLDLECADDDPDDGGPGEPPRRFIPLPLG